MEGLPRRPVVIKLVGGPSDGQYTTVMGFGTRCWQRIDSERGAPPYWALYVRTAPGIYTFATEIISLEKMVQMIVKQGKDRVKGSYGA